MVELDVKITSGDLYDFYYGTAITACPDFWER